MVKNLDRYTYIQMDRFLVAASKEQWKKTYAWPRQIDRETDIQIHRQIYRQTDRQMDRFEALVMPMQLLLPRNIGKKTYACTRQIDRETDRQIHRWMDI